MEQRKNSNLTTFETLIIIICEMDCKFVRECSCLCYAFHPSSSSIFILSNSKNRLRIIEQNLYTGLIMNEFPVPFKQQNLNVDNYILNYSPQGKQVLLTLYNHLLVFSLEKKGLVFVGQLHSKNQNPFFIEKGIISNQRLYFSQSEQTGIYSLGIQQTVKKSKVGNLSKFNIPSKLKNVEIIDLAINSKKLVSICLNNGENSRKGVLLVWDTESTQNLSALSLEQDLGMPSCLSFSIDNQHLIIGTDRGFLQVWDGDTLGVKNTLVLSRQQISKEKILSLSWFHYSGEAQSKRFLVYTDDGNVKLYSLFFQKSKDYKDKYMGRANQLSLLYINRSKMQSKFYIRSHKFANFIFFHPGILLYMIDYYPRIYYPVLSKQYSHSFEDFIPNSKKQIYLQSDFMFIDGLQIKRVRQQIEGKVALSSVLEYEGLKILKMDYRPKVTHITDLPLGIKNGIPSKGKLRYKFLINYYMGSMVRLLVMNNIILSTPPTSVDTFKEYTGHSMVFLGPTRNMDPLMLILQEDRQTITVICESTLSEEELQEYAGDERNYLACPGLVYSKQLKIKIQRIFETPFRSNYVLLYQSQNLIRFSNNIQIKSELIDYDVYNGLGLRLDYTDIIIDVVWSSQGELGCVICLEKIIFINEELKVIKSTCIEGYIIQGQFVGYTLILTTKVDVQYIDVSCQPIQLFCIQNYESKYLILGIMVDRILGIEKDKSINLKSRYFNLMEPLISGYLNYYLLFNLKIQPETLKGIVQEFAPYNIVSQAFILLLNKCGLSSFSKYFIEMGVKLYSRSIRYKTINSQLKMEEFFPQKQWLKFKNKILDYYLYYDEYRDSNDQYELVKSKQYFQKLKSIVGAEIINKIQQRAKNNVNSQIMIANSFGQKTFSQIYYDYNHIENTFHKMQIQSFKAENVGEWLGVFPIFIESKAVTQPIPGDPIEPDGVSEDQDDKYSKLVVYYRFDELDGENVDDISEKNNGAVLLKGQRKILENNQVMEENDKWGQSCPPQHSIGNSVVERKQLNCRVLKDFTVQLWIKSSGSEFSLIRIGENFDLGIQKDKYYTKSQGKTIYFENQQKPRLPQWTHLALTYNQTTQTANFYINSQEFSKKEKVKLKPSRQYLSLGSEQMKGQYTEFRLWRKELQIQQIRDDMKMPYEMVSNKRKFIIIARKKRQRQQKAKEKKEKEKEKENTNEQSGKGEFASFPFDL